MARRTVLWINHFAVTPDAGGGTRHYELGRELALHGWRVIIAASDFNLHTRRYTRRLGTDDRRVIRETVDGVEFRWYWCAPYERNDWRRVWNWITFCREVLGDEELTGLAPRVVIGSSPHLLAALAGWLFARSRRTRFLLEVRDLWPESLAVTRSRARGATYSVLSMLARFLYRRADRVIVLAAGARSYLEQCGVEPAKLVFIPNGVDLSAFRGRARTESRPLKFVYAGAHGPANGLDVLISAAQLLVDRNDVTVVLVGDGPDKSRLREQALREGVCNVEFRDAVAKRSMPAVLAECAVGLAILKPVPVFSFGVSPNKLFDYWAAGLPVVCNVPGEVEIMVREAGGGIAVAPGDAAALANGIAALAALTPDERSAMGERGRAWVAANRDRRVLAASLDGVLASFAA